MPYGFSGNLKIIGQKPLTHLENKVPYFLLMALWNFILEYKKKAEQNDDVFHFLIFRKLN